MQNMDQGPLRINGLIIGLGPPNVKPGLNGRAEWSSL